MKLIPTRRTDYGIRAMIHLAQQPDSALVKADEIADVVEVPRNFVPQVLQELQRAQLVLSRSGRTGGYGLGRPAEEISLLEIVEALEGPLSDAPCALSGGPCARQEICAIHDVWARARSDLSATLAGAKLATIARADQRRKRRR